MKIFEASECAKSPRADMFLPGWVNGIGFLMDALAVGAIAAAVITEEWMLLFFTIAAALLGMAAHLCYLNQKIIVLDAESFAYTTLLGKRRVYAFADIRELRANADSLTLILSGGKVHIESIAMISKDLVEKIDAALASAEQ